MSYDKGLNDIELMVSDHSQFILIINRDFIIKGFSANAAVKIKKIFGREMKTGDLILDLLDSKDKSLFHGYMDLALQGNALKNEWKCHGIDRKEYWFELYGNPVFGDKGKVIGVCITSRSISDLNRKEALTKRQLMLEKSVSNIYSQLIKSPQGFEKYLNLGLKDLGVLLGVSRTYIHIFEKSIILKNRSFEWCSAGADIKPIPQCAMESLKEEILHVSDISSSSIILPINSGDRNIGCMGFDYEDRKKVLGKEDIKILRIFCQILNDIIERNQKERTLTQEEKKFREMFNHENDLVFVSRVFKDGSPGPIIEVNDMACKKLGYSREELLSKWQMELGRSVNADNMRSIIPKLFDGEPVFYEMIFFTKTGGCIPVDISARFFVLNNEQVVLTVARDITERKRIEEELKRNNEQLKKALDNLELAQKELVQQEKLVVIGQLAAGVAHEINNPLGYICSNIETSRRYFTKLNEMCSIVRTFIDLTQSVPSEEIELRAQQLNAAMKEKNIDFIMNDLKAMFDDIEGGLDRISEIVTGLKSYARPAQDNEFEEYDLNKSIQNTLIIAKNDIKYHAEVNTNLGDIPNIKALGSKIDQVLLNIILNASYAIKDKKSEELGLITVTTDINNGFVRCRIEDNGTGIDEKHMSKIFAPFYTTKPIGEGTGMGLSIAYDIIVNQHNGQLLAESTPMVGSKFIILLPVS